MPIIRLSVSPTELIERGAFPGVRPGGRVQAMTIRLRRGKLEFTYATPTVKPPPVAPPVPLTEGVPPDDPPRPIKPPTRRKV